MKTAKFSYFMPLLACALALGIFGCAKEDIKAPNVSEQSVTSKQEVSLTTRAAGGNQMANGGGTTVEGGEKSTFVFNAVKKSDGSVTGHLVYLIRVSNITVKMDLDCVRFIGGNIAVMSGIVTEVSGENIPWYISVGSKAFFEVVDKGQGNDSDPDLISDLIFPIGTGSANANCTNRRAGTYLPISGNIQVKP